jgi:hypothetical protein
MARPALLDDELRERIESELADGIPIVVAQNAGVGRSTMFDWLATGRVTRDGDPGPLTWR